MNTYAAFASKENGAKDGTYIDLYSVVNGNKSNGIIVYSKVSIR